MVTEKAEVGVCACVCTCVCIERTEVGVCVLVWGVYSLFPPWVMGMNSGRQAYTESHFDSARFISEISVWDQPIKTLLVHQGANMTTY